MNFFDNLLTNYYRWFHRVKSSFEVMGCPSNYDHSESNIPPHIDCRFGFISSNSGGIGNFRWINSNPSNGFNPRGRIIWAGRWSLYVDSGRLTERKPSASTLVSASQKRYT